MKKQGLKNVNKIGQVRCEKGKEKEKRVNDDLR